MLEDDPEQEAPPQAGEGLVQDLVRVHVPVPELWLQVQLPHPAQLLHPPLNV